MVSLPMEEMCGPPTMTGVPGRACLIFPAMAEAAQTPTVNRVMPTKAGASPITRSAT